jgi:hypothetical protein
VDCPTATIARWYDMVDAVEEAPTLLEIDLIRLQDAPPELMSNILREGRVLYERAKRKATA